MHVGIQKRGFLNVELNDVTEAHGDFGLWGNSVSGSARPKRGNGSLTYAFDSKKHMLVIDRIEE